MGQEGGHGRGKAAPGYEELEKGKRAGSGVTECVYNTQS